MWPRNFGGFEGRGTRRGGDLGHVDESRSHLNGPPLIENTAWAQEVYDEIAEMRLENHANELEKLHKRPRTNEDERRLAEGPRDPRRSTRHGPLREVILTANSKWFEGDLTEFLGESGPTREQQLEALAVQWPRSALELKRVHRALHADANLFDPAFGDGVQFHVRIQAPPTS